MRIAYLGWGTILLAASTFCGCANSELPAENAASQRASGQSGETTLDQRSPSQDGEEAIDGVALLDQTEFASADEVTRSDDVATAELPYTAGNWVTHLNGAALMVTEDYQPGRPGDGICAAQVRDHNAIIDTDGKSGELVYQAGRLRDGSCWIEWAQKRYYYKMPNSYAKYLVRDTSFYWSPIGSPSAAIPANAMLVDYHNKNTAYPIAVCETLLDYHWYAGKYVNGNCYFDAGSYYNVTPGNPNGTVKILTK